MADVSQDLFGPLTETYSADLQQGSETPDLMQQDFQPDISLPPPMLPSCHHADPQGSAMLPHMQFLQSLCALHRVGGNDKSLQSLWLGPDGDAGSVLADTVCQLLDSVVAASRDPPPLGPCDLVLKACQVAARAMDLFCSQRLPSAEFRTHVEESLRELTGMLLHSNQPSRVSNGIRGEAVSACTQCLLINLAVVNTHSWKYRQTKTAASLSSLFLTHITSTKLEKLDFTSRQIAGTCYFSHLPSFR